MLFGIWKTVFRVRCIFLTSRRDERFFRENSELLPLTVFMPLLGALGKQGEYKTSLGTYVKRWLWSSWGSWNMKKAFRVSCASFLTAARVYVDEKGGFRHFEVITWFFHILLRSTKVCFLCSKHLRAFNLPQNILKSWFRDLGYVSEKKIFAWKIM